jgi:hypothetical protein
LAGTIGNTVRRAGRVQDPLDAELHVLGAERRAVVKCDTPPEIELPGVVVDEPPPGCEGRLDAQVGLAVQEPIEHVEVNVHGGCRIRDVGINRFGIDPLRDDQLRRLH